MKRTIEVTEQELKNLKLIRNYFGAHDKTQLEHLAFSELDSLVKKLQQSAYLDSESLKLDEAIALIKDPVPREETEVKKFRIGAVIGSCFFVKRNFNLNNKYHVNQKRKKRAY
jgi:hypothetical protein